MLKFLIIFVLFSVVFACEKDKKQWCSCATIEEHIVEGTTGYKISLFHLVPNDLIAPSGKSVLLGPGFGGNANEFTFLKNQSLACILYSKGISVWIINRRGSEFSRGHRNENIAARDYWDYSFDDSDEDFVAAIDHIRSEENILKLHYICHSAGCTEIVVLLLKQLEYQNFLGTVQMMAPAVYLQSDTHQKKLLAKGLTFLYHSGTLDALGVYSSASQPVVTNLLGSILALNRASDRSPNIDYAAFDASADCFQAEFSTKQWVHFAEHVIGCEHEFEMFDYYLRNKEKYESWLAPKYDVTKINITVDVWYSEADKVVPVKNIRALINDLRDVKSYEVAGLYHLDFGFAVIASELVYKPMATRILEN